MKTKKFEKDLFDSISNILISKEGISKLSETQFQGLQILIEKYGGKKINQNLPDIIYSIDVSFRSELMKTYKDWVVAVTEFETREGGPRKLLLLLEFFFGLCREEEKIRKEWNGVSGIESIDAIVETFSKNFLNREWKTIEKESSIHNPPDYLLNRCISETILPTLQFETIVELGKTEITSVYKEEVVYKKDVFVIGDFLFSFYCRQVEAILYQKITIGTIGEKIKELEKKISKDYRSYLRQTGIH